MPQDAAAETGAPAPPTTTPIPIHDHKPTTTPPPSSPPSSRLPTLRLEIRDLSHPGTAIFLRHTTATSLRTATLTVLSLLYPTSDSTMHIPPTRSITLILRSMPGVAYTTGTDLDGDHKEVHFSLDYISSIAAAKQESEIAGVLVHEVVHCFQYNGSDTCPGGLIEGVADWVRLCAGLGPGHWRRKGEGEWDAGYDTTAYFLEWVEGRCGEGVVRRVNEALREGVYGEGFWEGVVGVGVEVLWGEYCEVVRKESP